MISCGPAFFVLEGWLSRSFWASLLGSWLFRGDNLGYYETTFFVLGVAMLVVVSLQSLFLRFWWAGQFGNLGVAFLVLVGRQS